MFDVSYDSVTGMIRTTITGALSPEDQTAYISRKADFVGRAFRTNGRILHLVDATHAAMQIQFASGRLSLVEASRKNCVNRTAILTRSTSTATPARPSGKGEVRYFTDARAAEDWLRSPESISPATCGLHCCDGAEPK